MKDNLRLCLVQMNIVWADPSANHLIAEKLINEHSGADLYVLPEMWSTGFAVDPAGIAEENGETLGWMKQLSLRIGAAIAGSIAIKDNDKYYNRFYFVKPNGDVTQYDKKHLFTYGKEHERYSAGKERIVVEWKGVRFLLMTCYDLRFPEWSRNDRRNIYDAIIYVASWPASRRNAWDILIRARAVENQCYVCAVNRVGSDVYVKDYSGGTAIIDAYGRTVAGCKDREVECVCGEIKKDELTAFRSKFPVLDDSTFASI